MKILFSKRKILMFLILIIANSKINFPRLSQPRLEVCVNNIKVYIIFIILETDALYFQVWYNSSREFYNIMLL